MTRNYSKRRLAALKLPQIGRRFSFELPLLAIVLAAFVSAEMLFPGIAQAAETAAGHSEHGHSAATIAALKWPWINFVMYVAVMFFLLRGIVKNGWTARAERIAHEASQGERELAIATAELAAARDRQAKLPTEKASIARNLASEAQAEAQVARQEGEDRVREIEKQAANRIVAEHQAAVQTIRRSVAQKVLVRAEERIRSGISAENDKKLRQNTAKSLSEFKAGN